MKTTVLVQLTLDGPDALTEQELQRLWLELVPVEQRIPGHKAAIGGHNIKIFGARIVAGGRDGDNQPCQLPVAAINTDGWRLRKHGQIGTPEVPRLMSHVVAYADPDSDDKLPFVLVQCEPDNLDGTQGKVTDQKRFRTAGQVGELVAALMAQECSDGKTDTITSAQFLAELRERQPVLSRQITFSKGDLFQLITATYHSFTGRLSSTFHRHLCQTLFVRRDYEDQLTIDADEFWRQLEVPMKEWFEG